MSLASAAVAIIILVDIATGQGPPALQNYISGPQVGYNSPPIVVPQPIQGGYLPPPPPMVQLRPQPYGAKEAKEYEKEAQKNRQQQEKLEREYEKGYNDKYQSTPAPGVLASFQNSMSDAWKSFTTLGRNTRSLSIVGSPRMAASA